MAAAWTPRLANPALALEDLLCPRGARARRLRDAQVLEERECIVAALVVPGDPLEKLVAFLLVEFLRRRVLGADGEDDAGHQPLAELRFARAQEEAPDAAPPPVGVHVDGDDEPGAAVARHRY